MRFVFAPTGGASFRVHGCPVSDTVKPAGKRLDLADRAGFTGEHQKTCLKRILGILLVIEHVPADPEHHGTMTPDQSGKGALILHPRKLLQELGIAQLLFAVRQHHALNMTDDHTKSRICHRLTPKTAIPL
jgi:hypothetical protein